MLPRASSWRHSGGTKMHAQEGVSGALRGRAESLHTGLGRTHLPDVLSPRPGPPNGHVALKANSFLLGCSDLKK